MKFKISFEVETENLPIALAIAENMDLPGEYILDSLEVDELPIYRDRL